MVVQEEAENVVEASQIVGAAKVAETLDAPKVEVRIAVEGDTGLKQLNEILR